MGRIRVDRYSLPSGFVTKSGGRHDPSRGPHRTNVGWPGSAGGVSENLLPPAQGHAGSCRSYTQTAHVPDRIGAIPIAACHDGYMGTSIDPVAGANLEHRPMAHYDW